VRNQSWERLALPVYIASSDLGEIIAKIKARIGDARFVQLLIAGPLCLGVAAGQALAHIPARVEFVQLNQQTKEFETWVTNTDHLE
jgi:hypothetical protein